MDQTEILSGYDKTVPFLPDVQRHADSNRSSLGFFARSVFDEFARRDGLYVIVTVGLDGASYAGHLLFDRRFPRVQIVQMFTHPDYRRAGLASRLIDHLRVSLTNEGFTSIYARVAEDLVQAQAFWERQQFFIQRIDEGGATRNRRIIVRCHELASPQLFPTSGINASNPLGLTNPASDEPPLFLLDLNVLFDLAPRRLRHDEAAGLFQTERMNSCRLAISDEIREELKRTALQGKTDPMEAYINIFPSFPLSKRDEARSLVSDLAHIVFPGKDLMRLDANDWSDLRHVATAIQHELAGLITNDKKVLAAAQRIRDEYGIDVVSPAAFMLNEITTRSDSEYETYGASTLRLQDVTPEDEPAIYEMLAKQNLSGSMIATGWMPREAHVRIARRYIVYEGHALVGYVTWTAKGASGVVNMRLAVDEAHMAAFNSARILLRYSLEQLALEGPQQVRLDLAPRQPHVRDVATGFGFRGTPDQNRLSKIVLGRVLTIGTWSSRRAELADSGSVKLPETIPEYTSLSQHIRVLTPNGNQAHVTLEELESLISPALLCLPGRPAVITPVQRSFAEPLLGHSEQKSWLPHATASLFQERHYLCDSRTLKHFKRGSLILFYESTKQGGRAAVVAIARVRQAYLRPAGALGAGDLEQSVLTPASLASIGQSSMKTVVVFDNIFTLHRPVPLAFLRRIGCGRSTDLITTRPLTDAQLQEILREAFQLA